MIYEKSNTICTKRILYIRYVLYIYYCILCIFTV